MLKTAVIGKTANGTTQLSRIMIMSGDRIVLVDATTGQPPKKVTTKMVNKDLHIFAEGATEPSVILNDYASFDQTVEISGLNTSGAYVNYATAEAGSMVLGATPAAVEAASAPIMSTSAWWGVGILAVAGGVAAAAGGGGGGDSTTTAAPGSTTLTATLVDSVVSGVSYTTTSDATVKYTGANGSFSYKTGDTITFKVGAATIGSVSASAIGTDGIVMPQDIGTNATAVTNIAQFLQTMDSDSDPTNGITINSADAAKITTVIDIQTASDTVVAQVLVDAGIIALVADYVTETAANTHLATVTGDSTAPTVVSIILADSVLTKGEQTAVTVTFSEAVVGFTNEDVAVQNGTLDTAFTTADGGTTWTAIFTPTDNIADSSNIITVANTYTDTAGNAGVSGTSANYSVQTTVVTTGDTTSPTATITLSKTALKVGETADVTIRFNEEVTGFVVGDLYADNGTLSGLTTHDSITFTALFTPTVNIEDGINVIGFLKDTYSDIALNGGMAAVSANYTLDTKVPAAPIISTVAVDDKVNSLENLNLLISGTGEIGATVKLAVTNQTAVVNDFGEWSITVANAATSFGQGAEDIRVLQTDIAGNISTIDTQAITIDTIAPVKPVFSLTTDDGVNSTDGITHTNVVDVALATDMASWEYSLDKGAHWTLGVGTAFNFAANATYAAGDIMVRQTDDAGNVSDSASNTQTVTVDTAAPTVIITDNKTTATNGVVTFTLTFSENVYGLSADDITIGGGMKGAFGGSGSVYTLEVTPTAGSTANITVDIDATVMTDLAGNSNVAITQYTQAVDTVAPTATVVLSDSAISVGETATVTVTFSEIPVGFDAASDLVVENGSLSGGGFDITGKIYTATFTPTAAISDSLNNVRLADASYTDAAGNSGRAAISLNYTVDTVAAAVAITSSALTNDTTPTITGTAEDGATITAVVAGATYTTTATAGVWSITTATLASGASSVSVTATTGGMTTLPITQSLVIDSTAPTATIVVEDTTLTVGQTSGVTITFSEAVQNFTLSDLTAANGTLSTLSTTDNITWTATFTPTANVDVTAKTITLATSYADVVGNTGTVATSNNYAIDTQSTIPIMTLNGDTGVSGSDFITFNKAVDVALATDMASWEYSLDKGAHWTLGVGTAFNFAANATYAAGDIMVRQTDDAGNVSDSASNTQTVTVDTAAPTVIITDNKTTATNGVVTFTLTFSENVYGLSADDITIGGGMKGAFGGSGSVYTLEVTPTAGSTANITVDIDATVMTDLAGNSNVAITQYTQTVDTVAPTYLNGTANAGSDVITLNFNDILDTVDFSSIGNFILTVGNVDHSDALYALSTSGSSINIVLDTSKYNISMGDTVTIAYSDTSGDAAQAIQDLAGNDVISFGNTTLSMSNIDTPPVLTAMAPNSTNEQIVLTFNEALNASNSLLPALGDFGIEINGVAVANPTGVTIAGTQVTLQLGTNITLNDLVKVTYTDNSSPTNAIQDLVGNDALSFTYTNTAVI